MPRGRISKFGIKRGDPRVSFVVPQARYDELKAEADLEAKTKGERVSVGQMLRERALGSTWNRCNAQIGVPQSRELTVEYDGEVNQ